MMTDDKAPASAAGTAKAAEAGAPPKRVLPKSGGRFKRQPDGSLKPHHPEKVAPAAKHAQGAKEA